MNDRESKLGVALVHLACPVCGKACQEEIVMNSTLSKKEARKIEDMHGKCIGMADKPCDECKENMKKAFLFIIIDKKRTEDMKNPYRTGQVIGINKECDFIKSLDPERTKHGYTFIDIEAGKQIGILKEDGSNIC